METLALLLERQPDRVPWDALTYVTGHIHYGGRVTDDWDRRCVLSLLGTFYREAALHDGYCFADLADADAETADAEPAAADETADPLLRASRSYISPPAGSLDEYRRYVDALPLDDAVSLFGLHQNAKITCGTAEAAAVLRTMIDIQPRLSAGSDGASAESTAAALAARLASELPPRLDRKEALQGALGTVSPEGKVDVGSLSSLQLVLLHELDRFNHLLSAVATSLHDLQRAIAGTLVMHARLGWNRRAPPLPSLPLFLASPRASTPHPSAGLPSSRRPSRRCFAAKCPARGRARPTRRSSLSPRGAPTCAAVSTSSAAGWSRRGRPSASSYPTSSYRKAS